MVDPEDEELAKQQEELKKLEQELEESKYSKSNEPTCLTLPHVYR